MNFIASVTEEMRSKEIGRYVSKGFDTYGAFKMVGGLQKEHHTAEEIQGLLFFIKK